MAEEKVRCVNHKINEWGMFPKEFANAKWWQDSTGFYPEPKPAPVATTAIVEPEPTPEPAKKKGGRPKKTNQPQ